MVALDYGLNFKRKLLIFVLTFKDQKNQYLFLNTYNGFISKINKAMEVKKFWYLDNCPPRKIAPPPPPRFGPGVGVWAKVRFSFRVGGQPDNRSRRKLLPPSPPPAAMVRVRVWLRVSFGVGGQFSSGAIFLQPLPVRKFISCFL